MAKLVRDAETEPSYRVMKQKAVNREGREEEFAGFFQQVCVEFPTESKVRRENRAWDLMGLDNQTALIRWRDHEDLAREAVVEVQEEALASEEEQAEKVREFEDVFSGLPREADRVTVLKWIEDHPAMVLLRPTNSDGLIELTVDDIRDAPSRNAVGQLQHWVNQKDKFYAEWMKRKPVEKDDDDDDDGDGPSADQLEDHDPTLKDVEKMLADIGC